MVSKEKLAGKEEETKKEFPDKKDDAKKAVEDKKEDTTKACDDEDMSEMDETEKSTYLKLKAKVKKKMISKGEGSGVSPEQGEAQGASSGTISPNAGVPSTQNVFVPTSGVAGKREQSTPMDGMHKSFEPDLEKSPLFINLSKKLDDLQASQLKRIEDMEKSVNDRLSNIKADVAKVEEFYSKSFYKAANTEVGVEKKTDTTEGLQKQLASGRVSFR